MRDTPSTSGLSSCSTFARRLDLMSTSVPVWKPLPSMILRTTRVAFRLDLESMLDFPDFTSRVWLVCLLVELGWMLPSNPTDCLDTYKSYLALIY